jgi:hypothetical protein
LALPSKCDRVRHHRPCQAVDGTGPCLNAVPRVVEQRRSTGEIERDTARASVASWFGLAAHADAFRLSRSIFLQRDVENLGKRLLLKWL